MFYIFIIAVIFIIIAIVKNNKYEYLKQSAFAVMVVSILNCVALSFKNMDFAVGATGTLYLGIFTMTHDKIEKLFNYSLVIALIGLVVYLFTDAERT